MTPQPNVFFLRTTLPNGLVGDFVTDELGLFFTQLMLTAREFPTARLFFAAAYIADPPPTA